MSAAWLLLTVPPRPRQGPAACRARQRPVPQSGGHRRRDDRAVHPLQLRTRPAQEELVNTITASRLVKAYGRQRALDELDLSTTTGVTGLLGPNGAGKTTLLRILATVLPADAGDLSHPRARPRQLRRAPVDPATTGLHAPGRRLPPFVHDIRGDRLRRGTEGMGRPRRPPRRGAAGALPGRAGRREGQARQGAIRRHAAQAGPRPGPARRSRPAGPR